MKTSVKLVSLSLGLVVVAACASAWGQPGAALGLNGAVGLALLAVGYWWGRRNHPRSSEKSAPSDDSEKPAPTAAEKNAAPPVTATAVPDSEGLIRRFFHASPVALALTDYATGEFLDANDKFCQLCGRSRQGLIGHRSEEIGLWAHRAKTRATALAELDKDAKFVDVDVRISRPDGSSIDVAVSFEIVELAGRKTLFSGFFEITARKEAEVALRERELLLSSINENLAGTCVYRMLYHPDGRMECTYISPNVEELAGVSVAQMKADARIIFSHIEPGDLPGFRAEIARAMQDGTDAAVTVRYVHPAKGVRWAQFRSVCAERRANGAQVRDGVVVDVTADHIMADELLAVRQRLELALSASQTCIWEDDLESGTITLDATWAVMRGYPRKETVTTLPALLRIAHPEDRAVVMAEARRAVRGEADEYRVEQRVLRADGRWVWVLSHGQVISRNAAGRAIHMIGTNTDITRLKQAEAEVRQFNANLERLVEQRTAALAASTAELAKSEKLYRTLVESIHQGHFITSRRSVFTYCNPAIKAVLGRSDTELLGTSVIRLIAPEDRARVIATYQKWMTEGAPDGTIDFRVVPREGQKIWVEQSATIVRDERGRVVEFRNTVRDISERKAAEAMLWESNVRFQAVFQRSPILMGLLSVPDGRIIEFNEAGSRAFGYRREEALGRTSVELNLWVNPADREFYLQELRTKGRVEEFEAQMRRKNGEIFTVLYSGSLLEIGGRWFSLNSIQDISARREAEKALRASEQRLVHALDATRDGLWDWNIVTGEVYYSPQYYRLLGYAVNEFPGSVDEFFRMLHRDDVARARRVVQDHLAGVTPMKQADVRLLTKSGDYRWFFDRGKVVEWDSDQKPTRMVGTITDITDRLRAEQEREKIQLRLLQNQKYEALGTLAGGVAHDFNNILTGFINYTQLARQDCPPAYPHVRELLDEALGCADRAKELVRQILLLSRSEDAQRSPVALAPLVKEALSLLRSTLPASVEISSTVDPQVPTILANQTQIHQVLMNLAINAAHAMRERGGVLTVRVSQRVVEAKGRSEASALRPGVHACIEVTDTGTGMPPEILARIFEPFFTTKAVGEGTGLGLSVVHSVVRSHNGVVEVRSKPGFGTTFELYFPAHVVVPVDAPAKPKETPRGNGQRILLVDDEIIVVTSLQRMLERLGYKVATFTHPEQAWRVFEMAPDDFDVIFSDFQMPGMTGLELVKKCLAVRPGIPVFIASGFAGKVTPEKMREAGVRQFFQKPIEFAELAAAIAAAVKAPSASV